MGIPLLVVFFVLSLMLTRGALPLGSGEQDSPAAAPWWMVLATTGVATALAGLQVWQEPASSASMSAYTMLVLSMVLGLSVRIRPASLLTALAAGVVTVVVAARHPEHAVVAASGMLLGFVGLAIGYFTAWSMEVVRQQARSRHLLADLAVAEERLRFSRDLHDTFGRTLSVVSLKAELGAELARRGRTEEAAAEMDGVRQVTQEGAAEVRRVVSGYRNLDPAAEWAGARAVLRAAGIEVEATGKELLERCAAWSDTAREAVAWTLREAVTNILRHSDARQVQLALGEHDGWVEVEVVNDGGHPTVPGHRGTGLQGLQDRVTTAGGHLHHESTDGRFVLTASIPSQETP
ncbi:hypothetical protein BJF82_11110 [Kytococcus sp. CUA-901]|nr:hypothetical protein BJF82_11110 [Kytococcus sp. CUA-901]